MPVGLSRWTLRLAWRSDVSTRLRLARFAAAERNSFLELCQAANDTHDPGRAAAYLRHAADEARHTTMFLTRARELGEPLPFGVSADTVDLFDTLGEPAFLAFVADGEADACTRFVACRDALSARDPRTAAVFDALLPDETRHAAYTRALQEDLGPATGVARWVWGQRLGRLRRRVSGGLYTGLMWGLYPLLLPLAVWTRWTRPT